MHSKVLWQCVVAFQLSLMFLYIETQSEGVKVQYIPPPPPDGSNKVKPALLIEPKAGEKSVEGEFIVAFDAKNEKAKTQILKKYVIPEETNKVQVPDIQNNFSQPEQPKGVNIGDAVVVYKLKLTKSMVQDLTKEDGVIQIEPNYIAESGHFFPDSYYGHNCQTQVNAKAKSWGLARIDERSLFPNDDYEYDGSKEYGHGGYGGYGDSHGYEHGHDGGYHGSGHDKYSKKEHIYAYISDTGVAGAWRNNEFKGRWKLGYDATTAGNPWEDIHGHGTHVSGTVGSTTYGVAKNAIIIPVRIAIHGFAYYSDILQAFNWIIHDVKFNKMQRKAVVNYSFGGPASAILSAMINQIHANDITFIGSAGNSWSDACLFNSAGVSGSIGVGCSTSTDSFCSFSNWGKCVDIVAPGMSITSLHKDGIGSAIFSGTSMSAPHVTGATVVLMERAGKIGLTPEEVRSTLKAMSTKGKISGIPDAHTPNELLYIRCAEKKHYPIPPYHHGHHKTHVYKNIFKKIYQHKHKY